eukprot:GILI01076707.1.p1 GENE.GILI01076707.1~~GILI01076707.1.p1  ORF type:complete len:119 (-),score=6.18 GILI01076707.1:127-483(-)
MDPGTGTNRWQELKSATVKGDYIHLLDTSCTLWVYSLRNGTLIRCTKLLGLSPRLVKLAGRVYNGLKSLYYGADYLHIVDDWDKVRPLFLAREKSESLLNKLPSSIFRLIVTILKSDR